MVFENVVWLKRFLYYNEDFLTITNSLVIDNFYNECNLEKNTSIKLIKKKELLFINKHKLFTRHLFSVH